MNLDSIDHRPWKLPEKEWTIHMVWHDLLFLHWPVPVSNLRSLIPAGLEIDTYGGQAWIGVVPFSMSEVYRKGLKPFSSQSRFCELNVRTYVKANGKAGVWFFSLDTESLSTVLGARLTYQLPYYPAKMSSEVDGDSILYASKRFGIMRQCSFTARYTPKSQIKVSSKQTLEHWLTERYRLYTRTAFGQIAHSDIHHDTWPLQEAEVEVSKNTMHLAVPGLSPFTGEPLVHFARRLEVVAWPLEKVRPTSS
jgi:uncharacterized protein